MTFFIDMVRPATKVSGLRPMYDIMISLLSKGMHMAQFVVRSIENTVKQRLQRRAARHGRSMEEEVREILRSAVNQD